MQHVSKSCNRGISTAKHYWEIMSSDLFFCYLFELLKFKRIGPLQLVLDRLPLKWYERQMLMYGKKAMIIYMDTSVWLSTNAEKWKIWQMNQMNIHFMHSAPDIKSNNSLWTLWHLFSWPPAEIRRKSAREAQKNEETS